MATKTWTVDTGGTSHEVALDWGYWGGRREVRVDGEVVDSSTVPLRWSSTQEFDLDGHRCVLTTRPSSKLSARFRIELEVDGEAVRSPDAPDVWETRKQAA